MSKMICQQITALVKVEANHLANKYAREYKTKESRRKMFVIRRKIRKLQNMDVLEILGYILICNEYIHTLQLKFIERLLKSEKDTEEMVCNVLKGNGTAKRLQEIEQILCTETAKNRVFIFKILVRAACLDGEFDETEQEFLKKFFPEKNVKKRWIKKFQRYFKRKAYGTSVGNRMAIIFMSVANIIRKLIGLEKLPVLENIVFLNKKNTARLYTKYYQIGMQYGDALHTVEHDKLLVENGFLSSLQTALKDYYEKIAYLKKQDLTLAFAGRTGAGKTTLFYLMTGMGDVFITGHQRATRYSVVSHIHGIRVIDTPGVNAPNGAADEKLAQDVILWADYVGYVFPAEGAESSTVKFLNSINNKKTMLIVNYKDKGVFRSREEIYQEILCEKCGKEAAGWKKGLEGWLGPVRRASRIAFKEKYVFLEAAKNSKSAAACAGIGRRERKKIYLESGYPGLVQQFWTDFSRHGNEYRMGQFDGILKDFKSTWHQLTTGCRQKIVLEKQKCIDKKNKCISLCNEFKQELLERAEHIIELEQIETFNKIREILQGKKRKQYGELFVQIQQDYEDMMIGELTVYCQSQQDRYREKFECILDDGMYNALLQENLLDKIKFPYTEIDADAAKTEYNVLKYAGHAIPTMASVTGVLRAGSKTLNPALFIASLATLALAVVPDIIDDSRNNKKKAVDSIIQDMQEACNQYEKHQMNALASRLNVCTNALLSQFERRERDLQTAEEALELFLKKLDVVKNE